MQKRRNKVDVIMGQGFLIKVEQKFRESDVSFLKRLGLSSLSFIYLFIFHEFESALIISAYGITSLFEIY